MKYYIINSQVKGTIDPPIFCVVHYAFYCRHCRADKLLVNLHVIRYIKAQMRKLFKRDTYCIIAVKDEIC